MPPTAATSARSWTTWPIQTWIAFLAAVGLLSHAGLRYGVGLTGTPAQVPLALVLILGGGPLVVQLVGKLLRREFGSDQLAGISIVTSVALGEYVAGCMVVLMLSGGEALETYAVERASSVLRALARRMPSAAHRKHGGRFEDVELEDVAIGDLLVVLPHEICPVDGVVVEGHGIMDESYLTGEPFMMSKTPGAEVLSGAINGESALTIRTLRRCEDSRYAKIMAVMRDTEQKRPRLRRLGDRLGAWYTPIAILVAALAWLASGEPVRFLAVLVVATPCPLLIGIPVAIISAVSLAAKRSIIVRNPAVLEVIDECRTMILDKTGTLTYGVPVLAEQIGIQDADPAEVLRLAASIERYSKHPLAAAIRNAARAANLLEMDASEVQERPGEGVSGVVGGRRVQVLARRHAPPGMVLPEAGGGLECIILLDDRHAATYRFRDQPRGDSRPFVHHLGPKHHFDRILLVSGDRESEVRYLAEEVGIAEIHAQQSPEQKVAIVTAETAKAKTLFLGDGINDAPALLAATVGIAFGQNSDVTAEAAGAVIMDASLERVDEFLHISRRMRSIALQSAIGGMALSVLGMGLAACGWLPPIAGAISQEIIDLAAVLNALRVSLPPRDLTDFR